MKMKKNGVSRLLALVAVCLVLVGVGMIVHREGELAQVIPVTNDAECRVDSATMNLGRFTYSKSWSKCPGEIAESGSRGLLPAPGLLDCSVQDIFRYDRIAAQIESFREAFLKMSQF